jgi:hypothetical protein
VDDAGCADLIFEPVELIREREEARIEAQRQLADGRSAGIRLLESERQVGMNGKRRRQAE